ncbi:MAG: IS110 family transposase [Nevskiales bacterium]
MNATTVAVDLAKDVMEVAEANAAGKIVDRRRLSRAAFTRFIAEHTVCLWVMEACGSAHHWARRLQGMGHTVKLLPAIYVRPYRRRNKTDRADCEALLEAVKNSEILPVPVKSVEQQAIQGLHRIRSQWMQTRTARINALRGLLRELGITMPQGAASALKRIPAVLDDAAVPPVLREALRDLLTEVRELEARMKSIERQLAQISRNDPAILRLQQTSGIGLLTATALKASAGDARHFKSGRHLAAWLGLTPKQHSSGTTRKLGRISKRGDVYVRTLLTHGARSVLIRAKQLQTIKPDSLSHLQRWALQVEQRRGHNKAACALANKLARIAWATWRYDRDFDPNHAALAA